MTSTPVTRIASLTMEELATALGAGRWLPLPFVRLDRIPDVRARRRLSVFRVAAPPETEFPRAVRGDTSQVSHDLGRRAIDYVVAEFATLLERVARTGREW